MNNKNFQTIKTTPPQTQFQLRPDMEICQQDYPIDWYQAELIPYAEEYLALPDRKAETIIPWMTKYIAPAQKHFGDSLLLLAHYYMGGDIVKLIEHFGGQIGDSYKLAVMAIENPQKKIIVESAVHFMAESIAIFANDDQHVYITNPKSGCTMEMFAKDFMVEPALSELSERYDILPICYVNTSGRIKALTGQQGGAACTSSNVKKIFEWALKQNKKILFIPDKNMGENVAHWLGIKNIAYWPCGMEGATYRLQNQDTKTLKQFDDAQLILFSSFCGVHNYFKPPMVDYWHKRGFTVLIHPEATYPVVEKCDGTGSTAYLWDQVFNDKFKTKKYAVGTENHMVQNLKLACQPLGIDVVNLGDAKISDLKGMGWGCATMSRNDPPHLAGVLDLLRQGKTLDFNEVKPGDVVDEVTGERERLDQNGQQWIVKYARRALQKMIEITETI